MKSKDLEYSKSCISDFVDDKRSDCLQKRLTAQADWFTSRPLSQPEGFAVPGTEGFEVYEEVVVIFPNKRPRSPMDCPGRLVPDHLARGEDDLVAPPVIVLDEERPGLLHLLADVEDGGDDVSVEPVHVGRQPGPVGVPPVQKVRLLLEILHSLSLFIGLDTTCLN